MRVPMSRLRTMHKIVMTPTTRISIDGETFILAEDCDVGDLMGRIESASHGESGFVTFASRSETLSVLVTRYTRVMVSVEHSVGEAPGSETGAAQDWYDDYPGDNWV